MVKAGQFVEVLGYDKHRGQSGVVEFVRRGLVAVRLAGETIHVEAGCLVWIPTPTEIRRARRQFREKHLAALKPARGIRKRMGGIREYPATIFGPNPD